MDAPLPPVQFPSFSFSFSFRFQQKSCQIISFCQLLRGWHSLPLPIREILDPPLQGVFVYYNSLHKTETSDNKPTKNRLYMKGSSRNFPCGFNDDFKVFKSANSSQSHMLLGTEKREVSENRQLPQASKNSLLVIFFQLSYYQKWLR